MPRRGENIYKRKDGRWEGRYRIGFDEQGKSKYRSVYGKSYQEIKELLLSLKSEPIPCESSGKLTVKELFEEWLSAVKFKVKPSTYANYRMKVDKHILPEFGGMRYEQLTANHLHVFMQKKLNSGLSAKYVSDIVVVVKSMAKYTMMTHHFQNQISGVMLPKCEKKEMKLFSSIQQKQLCQYLTKNLNLTSMGVLMSLYTGLRIGEICAMRWGDIDFRRKLLTVRRTVQRIGDGTKGTKLLIDSPKTKTSCREIPVPAFLMEILKSFRGQNDAYILSGSSKIIEPRTMQYRFRSILKKANLPSINYHSLRHMFGYFNCV